MRRRAIFAVTKPATLIIAGLAALGVILASAHGADACEVDERLDPGAEGILEGTGAAESAGVTQSMSCQFLVPGPHLRVTQPREPSKADMARASALRAEAHKALEKYENYRLALQDGYEIRFAQRKQKLYHFSNLANAKLNTQSFDPGRPTSLLYEKIGSGYKLVGMMYTAPRWASEADLDRRVPVSIAPWHLHTNFCIRPATRTGAISDSRFGPYGSIATAAECAAAGGNFQPVVFGWMTHVDLDESHRD